MINPSADQYVDVGNGIPSPTLCLFGVGEIGGFW